MTPAQLQVTPDGLPAAIWDQVLARLPVLDLHHLRRLLHITDPGGTLLVVSAHPDDETLGAGRLIAEWVRTGGRCTAVLATLGEACIDHVADRPPGIALTRLDEWHAATDRLGVAECEALRLPDGQLTSRRPALTTRLCAIVQALLRVPGTQVVIAAPYRSDPHPDHEAAYLAAASVAATLGCAIVEYPIWMTYWTDPCRAEVGRLRRLVVDEAADRDWQEAITCFESQLTPLLPHLTPVVPPELWQHPRDQLLLLPADDGR